ncbi:outer membrane beta-barrel protein [Venatoribacter cucullus]|uniref:Outer membrane beta-barrel protein n=1 Tax=Venatoribacter cucullus TaxID=2661630 RepID=A0A9X7UUV5_9GAMM|nr:TonB-dependent receptor [Venatoribacter cucullus]QQD23467.1 outer membrane beta-barrel protein [Venatoribacter cucullus]
MSDRPALTAALLALVLTLASAAASAMPQTQGDRAYPQEVYSAADYQVYNPQTLYDLLQRLPGVTLGMQADGLEEIQLHGVDTRYLSLLINGLPVTGTGLNSSLLTRQIPASLVQRIEIDRSGRADLYTGGGGGGTINVILADAYSHSGLQLSLGGPLLSNRESAATQWLNEQGDQALRIAGEHRLERRQWRGSGGDGSSSGNFRQHFREQQKTLLLNYAGLFNERHPVQLYALQIDADEEDQRQGFYPLNALQTSTAGTTIDQQQMLARRSQRFGGDMQLNWEQWHLSLFFLHERFRQQRDLRLLQPAALNQQQNVQDQRFHAGWQLRETRSEHQWSTGLSLQYLQRRSDSEGSGIASSNNERSHLPYDYGYDEYRLSYFLLDRWHLSANTRLEAGFQVDTYELQHDDRAGSGRSEVLSDTHWLPSFHWLHDLSGRNRIRLSISQSTRQPEIADRIPYEYRQDERIWRGNDDLQAEVVSSFDLSYEHNPRLHSSSRNDRNSGYQIRLFQRLIRDAIVLQASRETTGSGPVTVFQPVNTEDSARVYGAELESGLHLPRAGLKLEFGAAFYHSEIRTDEDLPGRERLPGQPEYLLRLGASWQQKEWQHGLLWRLQGDTEQFLRDTQGNLQLQTRSSLQQLDLYTRRHWQHWQAGLNLSLNPSPAVRWEQDQRYLQLEERWYLRVNLSSHF